MWSPQCASLVGRELGVAEEEHVAVVQMYLPRADDELGKHHYGSTGGISYTTSHDSCDAFHKCKVGLLEGIATVASEPRNRVRRQAGAACRPPDKLPISSLGRSKPIREWDDQA